MDFATDTTLIDISSTFEESTTTTLLSTTTLPPPRDIPGFRETDLIVISDLAATIFMAVVGTILVLALLGNTITIIAVSIRKQRPLFRACLLSLAASDIIYASFTSTYYFSQFIYTTVSLWYLGDLLCSLIPFIQNLTLLASAFTLMVIAFDRYLALNKTIKGKWEPGWLACCLIFLYVWIISAGVSAAALWNYKNYAVPILIPDPENPEEIIDFYVAHMCIAEKVVNRKYYTMIFVFVFIPSICIFVWLNVTIAKEIWKRRKPITDQNRNGTGTVSMNNSAATTTNTIVKNKSTETNLTSVTVAADENMGATSSAAAAASSIISPLSQPTPQSKLTSYDLRQSSSKNQREARHIRMFKVIICLVAIFLICRLPQWIFLMVKFYGNITMVQMWLIHYSLGIFSLVNCVLNPFMYAFLSETLRAGDKFCGSLKGCLSVCYCKFKGDLTPLNEMSESSAVQNGIYMGRDSRQPQSVN